MKAEEIDGYTQRIVSEALLVRPPHPARGQDGETQQRGTHSNNWFICNGDTSVQCAKKRPMRNRPTTGELARLIKEFDLDLAKGPTVSDVGRYAGIAETTYYLPLARASRPRQARRRPPP